MTRYITLIRFTDQGVKQLRKSTARARAFERSAAKAGVTVEAQYWTGGNYDGVLILSGAEKDIMRALTGLSALGNVRTETMRAYDVAEFAALVGK